MEKKIIKNEYYEIELVEKSDNTLLKLLNNKDFRHQYFANEDLSKYTAKYMAKLRNQIEKEEKKNKIHNKIKNLFGDLFMSSDNLISIHELNLMILKDTVKQMEEKLGYLIYLDIITKEEAKKRGFDNDYIIKLLDNCEKELLNKYEKHITYPGNEKRAAENYDKVINLIK